ncbi:unnamed protein product [Fraxinus pennsylvanica]|uniref:Uncharacterized protein n=1 Tax=Fraxinus pennsylvanica TaxID=56036 RepID=A0AAD2AB26_9LAMI|nr:unnamed protein product [Fraxinus pennsylvanica]
MNKACSFHVSPEDDTKEAANKLHLEGPSNDSENEDTCLGKTRGMIMGAAVSTVYYNLKLRHLTIDMPIIVYDLVVHVQPMLMLGISIRISFNVIFADWMVTVLLIILYEAAKQCRQAVRVVENVHLKELSLLIFVWMAFLALQIIKHSKLTFSSLHIPLSLGVYGHESICMYKGWKKIASKRDDGSNLKVHQLITYCLLGALAGTVWGLLGVGGGSIMGPIFLELGIPP